MTKINGRDMNSGDSNVQYCVPQKYLQEYKHVDDNVHSMDDSKGTEIVFGCCCEAICGEEECVCFAQGGFNYNKNGALAFIDELLIDPHYTKAVFECNSCCLCPVSCQNRVVQRGLTFHLQVCEVAGKGFGVKSKQIIQKGSYVIDYAGDVLTAKEAVRRIKVKRKGERNYLLTVCERFGNKSVQTFIDAAEFGNVSRFINHSCMPNLLLHPVRVDSSVPRLALFAKRDILIGEELSFDYGGGNPQESHLTQNQRTPCQCNAPNCKGYLPAEPLGDLNKS